MTVFLYSTYKILTLKSINYEEIIRIEYYAIS